MELTPIKASVDLSQYALLRTILDSLETGALRYYLSASSDHKRNENFEYLRDALTPIINQIWEKKLPADTCPDGYYSCDGYCVSYPCTG